MTEFAEEIYDVPNIEENGAVRKSLPEIIDAADFLALALPQPPELIAGILHQGSKLAFGGGSKSFKTWCLLDLAFSVAHGLPWLSCNTAKGRVLYLNFEIPDWSWQHRLAVLAKAKGIETERGQLAFWNLRGKSAAFDLLLPAIRERAKRDFALIILDPVYKLYRRGMKENDSGDMAELMNAIEDLTVQSGAAVAFGAHYSKGNQSMKDSRDRISGSGVFARDPDSLLMFTEHEEKNAFVVEATLRNFAPVDPFTVRWQPPLMVLDSALDPAKLKGPGREPKYDPLVLLGAIRDTSEAAPISVSAWAIKVGAPRGSLTAYLARMREEGWIGTVGEGMKARRFITAKGQKLLIAQHDEN